VLYRCSWGCSRAHVARSATGSAGRCEPGWAGARGPPSSRTWLSAAAPLFPPLPDALLRQHCDLCARSASGCAALPMHGVGAQELATFVSASWAEFRDDESGDPYYYNQVLLGTAACG